MTSDDPRPESTGSEPGLGSKESILGIFVIGRPLPRVDPSDKDVVTDEAGTDVIPVEVEAGTPLVGSWVDIGISSMSKSISPMEAGVNPVLKSIKSNITDHH